MRRQAERREVVRFPLGSPEVLDLYQKRSGGVHYVEVDKAATPERF